jgi:hypothetical protein
MLCACLEPLPDANSKQITKLDTVEQHLNFPGMRVAANRGIQHEATMHQ